MALIFDPLGDLADTVVGVEDLLLIADADSDEQVAVLDIGAQAAGSLALALRDAANQAPTLIAPDGRSELGPVLRCPSASLYLPAVLRAVDTLPAGELHDRISGAMVALRLVGRCLPHDPGPAGVERDQAVREQAWRRLDDNIGVPATPWEAAVAADQAVLGHGWPTEPGIRWVLTSSEHAAYRRLAAAVLDDALDRFAMG